MVDSEVVTSQARRQRGFGFAAVADRPLFVRCVKKRTVPLDRDRDGLNGRAYLFLTSECLNCPQ
jgi:hypothetical protein